MRGTRGVAVCLTISLSMWSCARPTPPEAVEQSIGVAGGQVQDSRGDSVTLPVNALGRALSISITSAPDAPLPSGVTPLGVPLLLGPEGTQFAQAVTVTVAFDPTLLPAGRQASEVVIFTAPAGSTQFTSLGGTLVDATHVSATTTHFSVFVPAIAPPPPPGAATAASTTAASTTAASTAATSSSASTTSTTSASSGSTSATVTATGSTGGSGSTASTGASSTGGAIDGCDSCSITAQGAGGACSAQAEACSADSNCSALVTCFQACAVGDYPCADACAQQYSSALNLYNAVSACLCGSACSSQCAVECGGPTTGTTGSTGSVSSSCETCTAGATNPGSPCLNPITACTNDPSCTTFTNCIQSCVPGDDTCANACSAASPSGAGEYESMVSCLCTVECPSECAAECAGSPTTSATTGTTGSTGLSGTAGSIASTGTTGSTGSIATTGGIGTAGTGGTSGRTASSGTTGGTSGSAVCSEIPFVANGDIGTACDPDAGSTCASGEACLSLGGISFCSRDCTQDGVCPGGVCLAYDEQGDALCLPDCLNGTCPQPGALSCYALTPNPEEPGVCFPGCTTAADCNADAGTSLVCSSGTCRCTADTDCGSGGACDPTSGACYVPCPSAGDGSCADEGAGCCASVADGGVSYCDFGSWPSLAGSTGGAPPDGCDTCASAAQGTGGACADAVTTCENTPSCVAFVTCLDACNPGDDACATTCANANASGITAYNAVGTCICSSSACGSACAAECASAPPP